MCTEQDHDTPEAVRFFEAIGRHLNSVCFKGRNCFSFSSSLVYWHPRKEPYPSYQWLLYTASISCFSCVEMNVVSLHSHQQAIYHAASMYHAEETKTNLCLFEQMPESNEQGNSEVLWGMNALLQTQSAKSTTWSQVSSPCALDAPALAWVLHSLSLYSVSWCGFLVWSFMCCLKHSRQLTPERGSGPREAYETWSKGKNGFME